MHESFARGFPAGALHGFLHERPNVGADGEDKMAGCATGSLAHAPPPLRATLARLFCTRDHVGSFARGWGVLLTAVGVQQLPLHEALHEALHEGFTQHAWVCISQPGVAPGLHEGPHKCCFAQGFSRGICTRACTRVCSQCLSTGLLHEGFALGFAGGFAQGCVLHEAFALQFCTVAFAQWLCTSLLHQGF